MLDKNLFKEQMQRLKNIFPEWNARLGNKQVVRDWFNEFNHLSDKRFVAKVDSYIKTSKFKPTVAGILEQNKEKEENESRYTVAN